MQSNTTPSLDDELDAYNWLEDRFLKFVGSGESLFGAEIHDLFMRTSKDLAALIEQQVLAARIEELEGVQLEYSHYVATTYVTGKAMPVKDRCHQLAALEAEGAK